MKLLKDVAEITIMIATVCIVAMIIKYKVFDIETASKILSVFCIFGILSMTSRMIDLYYWVVNLIEKRESK
jgi:hypothetical protein